MAYEVVESEQDGWGVTWNVARYLKISKMDYKPTTDTWRPIKRMWNCGAGGDAGNGVA